MVPQRSLPRARSVALLAGVVLVVASCAGPDDTMRKQAAKSARDGVSEVETVRFAANAWVNGKLWSQPADRMVSDAESALDKVASSFDSKQPTTVESGKTYDETSQALSDAEEAVTTMRIALRNGDKRATGVAAAKLPPVVDKLRALGEQHK